MAEEDNGFATIIIIISVCASHEQLISESTAAREK